MCRERITVIGAGNGGMCAAAYAAQKGLKFRVIEQNPVVQDTRHWYGAIDSSESKKAGVTVNRKKLLAEISRYASGKCLPSFGIGTHFTNDFPGIKPMNIVIKLVAAKITESWPFYCKTCKLSEDRGKYSGDPETVRCFRQLLRLDEE